jgi:hypothetical protein
MTDPHPDKTEGSRPVPARDPLNAIVRRSRAARRLPPDAACAQCGETNPVLLEVHHIAGVANDEQAVVVLCLNHHRLQTVDQRAAGVDLEWDPARREPEQVISWLRGLALFFSSLAQTCRQMADRLAAFLEGS